MRITLLVLILFSGASVARADTLSIPINRMFFHDKITAEQKLIDKLDGKVDGVFTAGTHEEINHRLTDALFRKVKDITYWIERNDSLATNNAKVKYLTYVEQMLRQFRGMLKNHEIHAIDFAMLNQVFFDAMQLHAQGASFTDVIEPAPYGVAKIVTDVLQDNAQILPAREVVYTKFCHAYPDKILQTIRPYVNHPMADSFLVLAAKSNPAQLYSYAQSHSTPEGVLIHRNTHPVVQGIAALSHTPQALFYFPFLDNIMHGRQSVESIQKMLGDGTGKYDSVAYFKLLVQTEIDYYKRMAPPLKDTPVAMFGANGLRDMLRKKSIEHFVTPINELHNVSNLQVRMKAIEPLTATELYYMMVMGEHELYTSSYKHSFNRMLMQMGPKPRGDELLKSVHFDQFKKFIKLAAGYNKLDTFLRTMPAASAELLMKAFVANLDKTENLEDAVDVADSYSSITDEKLLQSILNYVDENLELHRETGNERGQLIYGLLREIFLSADSSNQTNLTSTLGIPSIYEIGHQQLQNEEGKVIQQVFFYGDEDGKAFFPAFVQSFSSKDWKVVPKKEWIEFISHNGKVEVYVNRPLDNDANLDDSAQVHLIRYMEDLGKFPTVVVHRGHSYWLPRTISRMSSEARIVLLGSCGGYKNLNQILEVCPDAHIISTKEIGKGDLNQPIINYLNQHFVGGKDIGWRNMWRTLTTQFSSAPRETRESWEDYVPPHRNLGAIFIKAYHRKIQAE
ncbi:MAG TPA: hypothetical protein PLE75_02160 [Ferruginibacter sp.]|nr:hypothetical protein [Ferruginibacter sp.]HRO05462.1 hypothetical protein [Ferruginibacter sp.]HRO96178.1 hypothetical protein [Ferruginibacter sp.]HRP48939.1 hypothetical protein [Ferruginibacter sp.]